MSHEKLGERFENRASIYWKAPFCGDLFFEFLLKSVLLFAEICIAVLTGF